MLPQPPQANPNKKIEQSRNRRALVITILMAVFLQVWFTVIHHVTTPTDLETLKEESSISPHVEWDDGGIKLMPLLEFINETAGIPGPNFEPNQPDSLYLLEKNEKHVVTPKFVISMNTYWKHKISFRRRELTTGLDFLESSVSRLANDMEAWPRLKKAMEEGDGFPFLINWDSTQNCTHACCDEAYEMDPSRHIVTNNFIPVLRLIAPRNCHHRLFIPTARVIHTALKDATEWEDKLQENRKEFKRNAQIQKVVWRGDNPKVGGIVNNNKNLFNAPAFKEGDGFDSKVFQEYAAVLDVDTVQYHKLLCQNSVVLRVKSTCLDMFTPTLEPWKHYIPVKADFSNLVEMAQFALSKEKASEVKTIMENANQWCQENLIYSKLQDHFLTTLTHYLYELDKADKAWPETWIRHREATLAGHFLLTRDRAYSLPKPVVGAIKTGFRRDDPRLNQTSFEIDGRLLKEITAKWGKSKHKHERSRV